jgi:hypothetical protein
MIRLRLNRQRIICAATRCSPAVSPAARATILSTDPSVSTSASDRCIHPLNALIDPDLSSRGEDEGSVFDPNCSSVVNILIAIKSLEKWKQLASFVKSLQRLRFSEHISRMA